MKKNSLIPQIAFILALIFALTTQPVLSLSKGDSATPELVEGPHSIHDLWIDMLMGPPLVPLFNEVGRSDDIAHVDQPQQLGQLSGIEIGQKMLIFRSVAEAEEQLPQIAAEIDVIGYNFEHGSTPPGEQADPVGSIQRMRALADEHQLVLAFGPDHDYALAHGAAMAPYVDIFVLQVQRKQTEPPVVIEFVSQIVPQLRAANEDLQISVQVRTEGDAAAIVALLETLLPYIDGVSILTSPDTVDVAEDLVRLLRGTAVYLPVIG